MSIFPIFTTLCIKFETAQSFESPSKEKIKQNLGLCAESNFEIQTTQQAKNTHQLGKNALENQLTSLSICMVKNLNRKLFTLQLGLSQTIIYTGQSEYNSRSITLATLALGISWFLFSSHYYSCIEFSLR